MVEIKVKSKLTNDKESQETVPVKVFKITDIPQVMENMGWIESARFMRKWFNDPYFEMTKQQKLNRVDMGMIDKHNILDDLSFDWLLTSSSRIKPIYDGFVREMSNVVEYNETLGRKKSLLNQLSSGLCFILNRLENSGFFVDGVFKNAHINYDGLSAMELDKISQFNFIRIGSTLWEKATDKLDDVYGALGSFIIKIAFTDLSISKEKSGFIRLEINELGLYVRDTYEFMNDGDDQPLGYWGFKGVIKPNLISGVMNKDYIDNDDDRYFRVTNSAFVNYREKYKVDKKTGDFFVYSTVKKIPVNIVIHLNVIDIKEYFDWKEKNAND
ncbi:DUF6402 family protein [Citrobacter tructae]|uniref:Uncharacterized protein n=1 Tax=Citrobacter tructae TaxID=2562449 RepID=A0ABX5T200_9ENTR|nr:DUF6402 family protein [Citrobacter tructae]QBX80455.1 hypothetical protein E4Z61_08815 [Citrobacter tructae]